MSECVCGHSNRSHIYEEGACRPGPPGCAAGCTEFVPAALSESALERLTRYNEADEAQARELEARVAAVLGATTHRRWDPLPIPEQRTPAEAVRRVLIYHRGALKVGTFGEECLCGWEGESWADHVAPLLVRAAHTLEVSG